MRTIAISLLLSLPGCGPFTTYPQPHEPVPVQPAVVETIFTVLADCIDDPDTYPHNTTQLELMLRHLRTRQQITDEQVAAVKAVVDCSKEVELTKADAEKIRGLK
ncbi:hypothetical protein [Schlesneria sp. T3-172]|uniref:hypothetical protein n=1 Tax=Schlesneria sphaerica TaxID=3373610 RepID=UPI0037C729CE